MKNILHSILLIGLIFNSEVIHADDLKTTVLISQAGSALCKNYAEELGRNSDGFTDMNKSTLLIANQLGFDESLQDYISTVDALKKQLHIKLINEYGSTSKIYFDWCQKLYLGYQKGLEKGRAYNSNSGN